MLKSALGEYGNVLDVGMLLEPSTDTYMGSGYAIVIPRNITHYPFTHKMKSYYNKNEFYAVWEGMPDFCHCCHARDHVVENCSK
ncbi:hypothetical protein K501DRAFT_306225 [Backusella circina FSU 941]|nr:hypothetical protein K501DRAFT_306225 [Backusella circina FSU 941]